jgi:6-phosphogluconolactonase
VNAEIRILPDAELLFKAAAAEFVRCAKQSVQGKQNFTVCLSGGSTPKGLYNLLATDAELRREVPWGDIYFFWGDERHVSPDDPDSNFRMANETLLSKIPVSTCQALRIRGEYADAELAAAEYEQTIRSFFHLVDGELPRFDLVLLGMGPDGHTASLFPGTKALRETSRIVVRNWVGKFFTDRITLTAPVLNQAATVMFLVNGDDKATSLKAVLEGPCEPEQLPAQLIRPESGKLLWLVDRSAARLLHTA